VEGADFTNKFEIVVDNPDKNAVVRYYNHYFFIWKSLKKSCKAKLNRTGLDLITRLPHFCCLDVTEDFKHASCFV
jgi:hypothetical protein